LTIEGKNLKQFFTLHINQQTIDVNNTQGSSDTIDDIEIPKDVTSGYVYLDNNLTQSNTYLLDIAIDRDGFIANVGIDFKDLIIWSGMSEKEIDNDGSFVIKLSKTNLYDMIFADLKKSDGVANRNIFTSIALEEDKEIELNSLNTSIALVWSRLFVFMSIDKKSWSSFRIKLSELEGVKTLSSYIATEITNKNFLSSRQFLILPISKSLTA